MKRFAILVVAVFAVVLMESQSEAQFYGGRSGFGRSGFNLSIGSGGFNRGFNGFNSYSGFNRGFGGVGGFGGSSFNRGFGGGGFNSFGPSYSRSYRPSYGGRSFYGGGGGCGY